MENPAVTCRVFYFRHCERSESDPDGGARRLIASLRSQ
jgi:hypothetical protein